MRIVTREEMRAIDRWAIEMVGIPSIVLMENAGRGLAEIVKERLRGRAGDGILVVCGAGNNGGDGFVAARHLANAGLRVALALAGPEAAFDRPGDAGVTYRVVRALALPCRAVSSGGDLRAMARDSSCVVDALFGTGLTRPVEGLHRELIEAINGAGCEVVAVDIPSGLDADSGRPLGAAVRAAATATMAFPKAGFFVADGPSCCGAVQVVDIGIPRDVPAWDGGRGCLRTGA
jgi:hydroxyethylthiazole kinase-like uncharacterized protein yjeF